MAILHVRSVPDELYERLKARAAAERRSLSGEVVLLLERAMEEPVDEQDVARAEYQQRSAALLRQADEWYRARNQPMTGEEYTATWEGIDAFRETLAAQHGELPDSVSILRADRERDERRWR